ncbi:hypothetical protein niasHT_028670 [Heterodera trifolii]|uniref:Serpin domain-containing protein n=1 Tax=Heterodera trifolii TaxID=157864 RepID=A0ABD2K0L9_9BILA
MGCGWDFEVAYHQYSIGFNQFRALTQIRTKTLDPRGAHLYTEQRQLTWQPTELKSISANGKVNIALQYPQTTGQSDSNQSIKHEHPETLEQNKCKELNVGFSMNLLNAIYRNCCADASSTQNTVLSPISAAMAYAGARGQTAAEFVNLLANGDGSSLHQNNAKFVEEIQSEKTFNLSIANKIFLNEMEMMSQTDQFIYNEQNNVSLPTFKIESTHNLEEYLPSLGLKIAFDTQRADFSGINGTVPLYIGKVLQKAMISVNEKGVEAAAATAVMILASSTAEIPPAFRADHPFAFFLVKSKKEVLFSSTFLGGE